jgi:hypothetical protein
MSLESLYFSIYLGLKDKTPLLFYSNLASHSCGYNGLMREIAKKYVITNQEITGFGLNQHKTPLPVLSHCLQQCRQLRECILSEILISFYR